MSLTKTTCTFCRKDVVAPCDTSSVAEYCNHRAPKAAPVAKPFTENDAVALLRKATEVPPPAPMKVQIGGDHYKTMAIQPITFIQANRLGWEEGNVVKYVSRWEKKGGIEDLKKARDILDKKIAFEEAQARSGLMEYLSALFKTV